MSRLAKNSVPSRYLIKCKKESGKNETLPKAQWFQNIYEIAIEFLIFLRFDNIFSFELANYLSSLRFIGIQS